MTMNITWSRPVDLKTSFLLQLSHKIYRGQQDSMTVYISLKTRVSGMINSVKTLHDFITYESG